MVKIAYRYRKLKLRDYIPTPESWEFHRSAARFRFLIWGIRSSKTFSGAREFARGVLGSPAGSLSWVIAPTMRNLQEARRELSKVLYSLPGIVVGTYKPENKIILTEGRVVQFVSADRPDNMRGPTVDGMAWFDECAFGKEEAHLILRERTAAHGTPIIYTTTPSNRNWVWDEVQLAGMPAEMPYGVFSKRTDDGGYFVSHYPTWQFPWVPAAEIEAMRARRSQGEFDREYGALFMSASNSVFNHVEDSFSRELEVVDSDDIETVIGLDLARYQDWTFLIVMDGSGRVLFLDRWNDVEWSIQRERIISIARQWKKPVLVLDKANVGSVIEEDMRDLGLEVRAVEMNSPQVKLDLIQSLQVAFERRSIKIPHPKGRLCTEVAKQLYRELCTYETSITRGGRLSYSAPRGLFDDGVVALALANWGRIRGLAGDMDAASVAISERDYQKMLQEELANGNNDPLPDLSPGSMRPKIFREIFSQHRSSVGFESFGKPFWRQ